MSLIYSILKPVLRKASAGRAVMTREDFVRQAEKKQRRNLKFFEIAGFEKKEREIAGCRCIVYSKNGSDHSKAMVYYAGGGYIRYQLPNKKSIRNLIDQIGGDLWIPLYPLYPAKDMYDLINEGVASLLKLSDRIDTTKMPKPSFMMVLCGIAPFAYRREDGVFVVPISCLKD